MPAIPRRPWAVNHLTWIAHAIQAVLIVLVWGYFIGPVVGFFASETHFLIRETGSFLSTVSKAYDQFRENPWQVGWEKVREDGLMDFLAPHVAGIVTALLWIALV